MRVSKEIVKLNIIMPNLPKKDDYLESIKSFHKQFLSSYRGAFNSFHLGHDHLRNASDIIIAGMGGSSFGGRVLISAFGEDELLIPVRLCTDYKLPAYADEKTLVVITSYSGNTEEVLSIFKDARSRGCKIVCIAGGGKLSNLIIDGNVPGYIFDTKYGSQKVPRTGIGYVTGSTFGLLSALGYIDFTQTQATALHNHLDNFIEIITTEDRTPNMLTQKFIDKLPVFIASEHLFDSVHIWRNFLNETAKSMGFVQNIPYMNHHFLDGLLHPEDISDRFVFVFIKSKLYHPRNQKRLEISRDIVKKHKIMNISLSLSGSSRLNEIWELIIMGCLVSYNLAKIYGANPSTNEMVDYLKESLDR